MVRGGVKARGHAREDWSVVPLVRHWDGGHGALTPPRLAEESCASPAMASAAAAASATARFEITALPDLLLVQLEEEASARGLQRLAGLLADELIERQAQQPEPPVNLELAALLPF
jgi:hypothetical protein